jgi:hypothetical protein
MVGEMVTISKTAMATGIFLIEGEVLNMTTAVPKAAEMDLAMATEKVLSTAAPITPVAVAVPTEAGSVEDLVTDEECDDTEGDGHGWGDGEDMQINNRGYGQADLQGEELK